MNRNAETSIELKTTRRNYCPGCANKLSGAKSLQKTEQRMSCSLISKNIDTAMLFDPHVVPCMISMKDFVTSLCCCSRSSARSCHWNTI